MNSTPPSSPQRMDDRRANERRTTDSVIPRKVSIPVTKTEKEPIQEETKHNFISRSISTKQQSPPIQTSPKIIMVERSKTDMNVGTVGDNNGTKQLSEKAQAEMDAILSMLSGEKY